MFDWLKPGESVEGEFFLGTGSLHFTDSRVVVSYLDGIESKAVGVDYNHMQGIELKEKRNLLTYIMAVVVFLLPGSLWMWSYYETQSRGALELGGVFLAIGIVYIILMEFVVKPDLELTFNLKDGSPLTIIRGEGRATVENIVSTYNRALQKDKRCFF